MTEATRWQQRMRRLRIALGGTARERRPYEAARHRETAIHARWIVRFFYLILLHLAFEIHRKLTRLADTDRQIDPLWPVAWIDEGNLSVAVEAVGLGLLAAAVAAAVVPDRRPVRILVAFFLLQALAIENSFGSINHAGHLPLWMAIVFAALPATGRGELERSRTLRLTFLTVVFLAMVLAALFYTSSGSHKAWFGFAVWEGRVSSFAPDALPLLVVQKWLQTGDRPLLAGPFIDHLWLAWPAHLLVIYVELFAVVMVFRPALHRLFGCCLIVFHLTVWLLLGISFPYQPVLVALLFVWSPFAPAAQPGVGRMLAQLPLIGDLAGAWRRWQRKVGSDGTRQRQRASQ